MLRLREHGDHECPACIESEPLLQQLVATDPGRQRLVFLHCARAEGQSHAELPNEVAEAPAAQGRFRPTYQLFFGRVHGLEPAALVRHAKSFGLA